MKIDYGDVFLFQFPLQIQIHLIFTAQQCSYFLEDCMQLFFTSHIGLIFPDILGNQHLIVNRTHPHHKEFI